MAVFENSCWSRRTLSEKILIVLNIIVVLLTIFLIISFLIYMEKRERVCYTPECTLAAARILKTLNWTINPCTNFFEMVCSKTTNPQIDINFLENNVFFNRILLQLLKNKGEVEYPMQNLPKTLFNQCSNKTLRRSFYDDFQAKITNLITEFDWIKTTIEARKIGFPINQFISFNIKSYVNHGNKPILIIGPAYHPDRSFKNKEITFKSGILQRIKTLVLLFNSSVCDESSVIEAIKFEQRLMKIAKPVRFALMNSYTTSELDEKFKLKHDIKWKNFIGVEINEQTIYVSDENYLKTMLKLDQETSQKTLQSYMQTRLIRFVNTVQNHADPIPVEDLCLKIVYTQFPIVLSDMYIKQLDKRTKYMISQEIRALKNCVDRAVRAVTWMDSKTQAQAHKKWRFLKTSLGYTSNVLNELNHFYENLELDPKGSFPISFLQINKLYREYWLNSLKSETNLISSLSPVYHLESAGYLQQSNEFAVGAQFLHDVYYNRRRPDYMNFAAFGSRITHYLIHGFDNIGKFYDYRGNLNKWWTNYSDHQYNKIAECVEEKYDKYRNPRTNISVDGYFTKDSNLADITAIDLAYNAYMAWTRMYGGSQNLKLPGINFTNTKTFWISYASSFCQNYRYDKFTHVMNTQNMVSNKYRVNIPLINSKNFRQDFQCENQTDVVNKTCQMFAMGP